MYAFSANSPIAFVAPRGESVSRPESVVRPRAGAVANEIAGQADRFGDAMEFFRATDGLFSLEFSEGSSDRYRHTESVLAMWYEKRVIMDLGYTRERKRGSTTNPITGCVVTTWEARHKEIVQIVKITTIDNQNKVGATDMAHSAARCMLLYGELIRGRGPTFVSSWRNEDVLYEGPWYSWVVFSQEECPNKAGKLEIIKPAGPDMPPEGNCRLGPIGGTPNNPRPPSLHGGGGRGGIDP